MPSAPSAASESREIRVFISSTFRDFMEERELLAKQVFPALNRRARERGVELVEVDLRWGVTQEQAEDGHVMEICLREIERCRPYFIGMLGDSYGSLMPQGEASYTDVEIGHSLELLRDPAMEDRAFFYFRDRAWSDQKADAGEAGWRSDDLQDRQRLERLRDRIRRSSGYPLVQGLQNPQAIAARIEIDLWALIGDCLRRMRSRPMFLGGKCANRPSTAMCGLDWANISTARLISNSWRLGSTRVGRRPRSWLNLPSAKLSQQPR